jgi:sugar phosphate permease
MTTHRLTGERVDSLGGVTPECAQRLRRWRGITLAALLGGYTGYYVCCSNLSVVKPLITKVFLCIRNIELGWLGSVGIVKFALGKVVWPGLRPSAPATRSEPPADQ